ncbi:SPFH/Band 7/PHB domain-containingmembrane-associated protein family [Striga asiatica]|uniref:SPFH/Band 7/PHB domain-containingmembrane-associated protein family n=1 Tax=Striga asiatica TaxID=4170 RepID=A0A5A7QCG1_STRAF|nr:SPFH/Band 7/PHB domain-containingmembrane-associated protein family [Striga asiatica]
MHVHQRMFANFSCNIYALGDAWAMHAYTLGYRGTTPRQKLASFPQLPCMLLSSSPNAFSARLLCTPQLSCCLPLVKCLRATATCATVHSCDRLDPTKEDKVIWDSRSKYQLSVAYAKLDLFDVAEKSKEQIEAKQMRKESWSLKIKGKIKYFLWRCAGNRIQVLNNLCKKGYVLVLFVRSKLIWKLSLLCGDGKELDPGSFKAGGQGFATSINLPSQRIDFN